MLVKKNDMNRTIKNVSANSVYSIKTLGGKSEFKYYIEENALYILYGKQTKFTLISGNIINETIGRIKIAKGKEIKMTSFYNQSKWNKCPNNILCPYVACLIINNII